MSVSKDRFGFIAGVAIGAAGYYLFTHPRYVEELGTKITNIVKTKLNDVTAAAKATVDTTTNGSATAPEEGVIDGTVSM